MLNALYIIAIVTVAILMLWGLKYFWKKDWTSDQARIQISPTLAIVLRGGSRVAVILVALIMVLRVLGVDTHAVMASVSALILVIAVAFFAVWSVLSNLFCAALLLFYTPFRVGDEIEIVEPGKDKWIRGVVADINLFFVTVIEEHEDGSQSMDRIPNNLILQKAVRNWPVDLRDSQSIAQVLHQRGTQTNRVRSKIQKSDVAKQQQQQQQQ